MMRQSANTIFAARARTGAALLGLMLLAGACSHMPSVPKLKWPFGHKPAAAPEVVHEIVFEGAAGANVNFPQYWNRNTLVIDMQGASGTGSAVAKPRQGTTWPMRLAFRVTAGQFGELEVKGDERDVFNIPGSGTQVLDLALSPSAYSSKTGALTLSWGPTHIPSP
ncbi:MAG TPA: hypothetical protein VF315_09080 [Steroidobacteraceae bacterium]